MTPDGNSDPQEEMENTGIGKYEHKHERLHLRTYFLFSLISLKGTWIFKANIIYFIMGFTTYVDVINMTTAQREGKCH